MVALSSSHAKQLKVCTRTDVPLMRLALVVGPGYLPDDIVEQANFDGLVLAQLSAAEAREFLIQNPADAIILMPDQIELAAIEIRITEWGNYLRSLNHVETDLWIALPGFVCNMANRLMSLGADYAGPLDWASVPFHVQSHQAAKARLRDVQISQEQTARDLLQSHAILSAMSRQLRTPMHSLLGFTELLSVVSDVEANRPRRSVYLRHIADAGEELVANFNALANFANLTRADFTLADHPLSILEECTRALNNLRKKGSMVTRKCTLGSIDDLVLQADEAHLRMLLSALLENALTHGGGQVELSARALASGALRIAVVDHGAGFGEASFAELSSSFRILDQDVIRSPGRLGLGLPTAYEIMRHHGGRLTAEPTENGGTTILATFPPERVSRRAGSAETFAA